MKFLLQEEVEPLKSPPLVISVTNKIQKLEQDMVDSRHVLAWLAAVGQPSKIEGWKNGQGNYVSRVMKYDGMDTVAESEMPDDQHVPSVTGTMCIQSKQDDSSPPQTEAIKNLTPSNSKPIKRNENEGRNAPYGNINACDTYKATTHQTTEIFPGEK